MHWNWSIKMAANFSTMPVDISQNSKSIGQYIDSGDVFCDSLSPVIPVFISEDLPARPDHNNPTKSANTRIYKSIIKDNRLDRIYEDLKLLVESEYDWEGYGLEKPKHYTILKTKAFISSFLNILDEAGCIWADPFIYSGEDGCVCLGWSNGSKSLYIHIHSDSLTYRKKLTSVNDMQSEEGNLDNENCISIWNWLINDE